MNELVVGILAIIGWVFVLTKIVTGIVWIIEKIIGHEL
jgi:hypothetical protein